MRVQGVYDYAAWLLEDTAGGPTGVWDKAALLPRCKDKERYDIKLAHAVPVIWVYLTGWANERRRRQLPQRCLQYRQCRRSAGERADRAGPLKAVQRFSGGTPATS